MRSYTFWLFWVLLASSMLACRKKLYPLKVGEKNELIAQLKEIWHNDQLYRGTATELRKKNKGVKTAEEAELWRLQFNLDSINWTKVKPIIDRFGYPGKSMVGEEYKSICAFVILHNPKIQRGYLPLLWAEAKKGNVDMREVAILEDRIRLLTGKPQIYGTAMKYDTLAGADLTKGQVLTRLRIWPIKNLKNLDKKRERVGWYSLRLQCELEGLDWVGIKGYRPQSNKFDFPFLPSQTP